MLQLLAAPQNVAFSAALLLMLALGAIEAIGLGAGGFDLDLDLDGGPLAWLGIGRVPLLMLLVAFLAAFGTIGLVGQEVARQSGGALLPAMVAVPVALAAALPTTGLLARLLARVLPHDETTAFPLDDLVGRTGTIVVGRAAAGSPARARVVDPHGQAHHVLVEPNDPADAFGEGDTVLLVRREADRFHAILHTSPRYSDWMNP